MRIISLGSDPEAFIKTPSGGYLPSIGLIGGSKDDPLPLENGFYIQEDNVMVEWNIPPSTSKDEFVSNMLKGIELVKGIIPLGCTLEIDPSAVFIPEQLKSRKAMEFGCAPDRDAYKDGDEVTPITLSSKSTSRYAGGHLHLGLESSEKHTLPELNALIKSLDLFLAIPSLLIDKDDERRDYYGKLGKFRVKPYGVEYRTLSNYWIKDTNTVEKVYENVHKAVEFVNVEGMDNALEAKVSDVYTNRDRKEAESLCDYFGIAV